MNILIAVTHLLGIGHFARMRVLARGLVQAGHQVTLVSGGKPQPHLDGEGFTLVQLPAVHCRGTDFSTLYQDDGAILAPETRAARRALLVETCRRVAPDIVITETFPFGRRALKDEFIALCEAADALRPRPAIVASIRDILNPPSSPAKAQDAEDMIARFYDAVLEHGDATLVPPEAGWPFGKYGARALRMTGYIDDSAPFETPAEYHDAIIVSGGGSAASLPLYRAAIAAAQIVTDRKWHVLIGHGVVQKEFDALVASAPHNMIVERARKDFRALLRGACLSISQAGYNTVVDLFDAGLRMVLVPFAAGQEQEQTLRADALAARNLACIVREDEVSGATLAQAVREALALPPPDRISINKDGVAGSIAALDGILAERRAIERAWDGLRDALGRVAAQGETLDVWWRDDDAIEPTPQLARLLALSTETHAPVALAVIPERATPELARALERHDCDVLIHGITHRNQAPAAQKKQELGFRPVTDIAADLRSARERLENLFGARALPVLVPPWNRIDAGLVPVLPSCGIAGLSTFKTRPARSPAPGVVQVNTHCDPVAWREGGGLASEVQLVAELTERVTALGRIPAHEREPIGLLTHHLVHDEAVWRFVHRLLTELGASGAVRFLPARAMFEVHQTVSAAAVLE